MHTRLMVCIQPDDDLLAALENVRHELYLMIPLVHGAFINADLDSIKERAKEDL
jgi:hypothetical protein